VILFFYFHFFAILIDGDVDDFSFGYANGLTVAAETLCFDGDADGYGAIADFDCFGVKAHEVTDKNGFEKNDFLHRHSDKAVMSGMTNGFDTAGDVDIT
jgi:hypothetical protein